MNRTVRSFIVLLALLALAGAQVFGLQRGYLCECSGEQVETTYEFCHHAHGNMHAPCADDHHEHDGASAVPQDHHHDNQGGSHEHTPLKVTLTAASQGKNTSAAAAVPVPVLFAIAELPAFLSYLLATPGVMATESVEPPYIHSGGPPGIRETAKCMVLLI